MHKKAVIKQIYLFCKTVASRAGSVPTFQDPGTPLNGLSGTQVPAY